MSTELPALVVDEVVRRALLEDLSGGDLTTESCIAETAQCVARGVARKRICVSGIAVAAQTFSAVDARLVFQACASDGQIAEAGSVLFEVRGSARSVLMGERVALNLIQRMCGVATLTRSYVDAKAAGSRTRITDTRKTTPGLRALERYAVRCGGGHNHRDNLGSAVLIKDNHVVAAGGVARAISLARERAPHTSNIECEVDTLEQLREAIAAGADIVMLDNMSDALVAEAIEIAAGRVFLEVSGGITLARIASLSALGVGAISVGALTHSAPAVDIGLDFS